MNNQVALDLYWLRVLNEDRRLNVNNMFSGRQAMSPGLTEETLTEHLEKPTRQLQDLLLFCEQLVINDALIVDRHALESSKLQIPDNLKLLLTPRSVPKLVYKKAAVAAMNKVGALKEFGARSTLINSLVAELSQFEGTIFAEGDDKSFHDDLDKLGLSMFAESIGNDTFHRTMFYLSFAEHFGAIVFLGRDKQGWLSRINDAIAPTVNQQIEKLFDEALRSQIVKQFKPLAIAIPPLPEFILRTALEQKLSLIEAAIVLRQSAEAAGYRRLLSEFKHWSSRGRPGDIEADKAFKELERVAQSWQKYCDPKEKISHSRRTLDMSKLPYHIGDVLKFAGMDKVEVKDIILTKPPAFLAFISRWYSK